MLALLRGPLLRWGRRRWRLDLWLFRKRLSIENRLGCIHLPPGMGHTSPDIRQFAKVSALKLFHIRNLSGDIQVGIGGFAVELNGLRFIGKIHGA